MEFKSEWFKNEEVKDLVNFFEDKKGYKRVYFQADYQNNPAKPMLYVGYQYNHVIVAMESTQGIVQISNAYNSNVLVPYNKTLVSNKEVLLGLIKEHNSVIEKDLEKNNNRMYPMK